MSEFLHHNYFGFGGACSAAGDITLQSHDARAGERLPNSFVHATAEEIAVAAVLTAYAAYPMFSSLRQVGALIFSTLSPSNCIY